MLPPSFDELFSPDKSRVHQKNSANEDKSKPKEATTVLGKRTAGSSSIADLITPTMDFKTFEN